MKVPSKSRLRKQYNNKKKTQTKKQTNKKTPHKTEKCTCYNKIPKYKIHAFT